MASYHTPTSRWWYVSDSLYADGGYIPGIIVDGGTSRTTHADGGFVLGNIVDGGLSRTIHTDGSTSQVCQDPILRGNNYDYH